MPRRKFETNGKGDSRISTAPAQYSGICENKMFFAERLKEQRTIAHISQIELADKLNLSRSAVANWETGRTRPDIANIPSICNILGISIGQFFCDSSSMVEIDSSENTLLFNYRKLNHAHQKVLLETSNQLVIAEEEMNRGFIVDLVQLPLAEDAVAAGVNMADFSAHCKPVLIHSSPTARRADMVFRVNGDSMEPKYPDKSYVLVKRDEGTPQYGEVGIFQVDNSLYIKEYGRQGLRSLNPKWPLMDKNSYDSISFIGRVIGVVDDDDLATTEEAQAFAKKQ